MIWTLIWEKQIRCMTSVIEHTTGITTIQEVSKKIIKITNNDISIKYEVK